MKNQNPPIKILQSIINFLNDGKFQLALSRSKQMLERFPNSAVLFNIVGASYKGLMQLDKAIDNYKKALNINPDYSEVYYNMGVAFQQKGDIKASIESYTNSLKIKPDYVYAYNNMGTAYHEMGNLEEAIQSYKKALKIKPDYADSYNNMANALKDIGELESAIDNYAKALNIKPNYAVAKSNIVKLLTSYNPQKENPNLIVKVNEEIRKINIINNNLTIISDDQVVKIFSKFSSYLGVFKEKIRIQETQTYRNNSVVLNCKRHMAVFDEYEIIPEFCFGCYKVQVEPKSIIDLIKLFIVFDQLELNENNTRKCMIELRPEISGFYKGLIYCSGLKQANQIAKHLDTIIKGRIDKELSSKVKRGCSEYPISFPDYKEINNSGPQLMKYKKSWKAIEENYDNRNPINTYKNRRSSLSGLNLNDALVIQKWIDYAKGISDPSADLLKQSPIYYQDIYDKAKVRLNSFNFRKILDNI